MNINGLIHVFRKTFCTKYALNKHLLLFIKDRPTYWKHPCPPFGQKLTDYGAWLSFVKFPHSFPSWFLLQLEWKILVGSNFPFLSNLPPAFKILHFCSVYIVSQLTAWLYNTWNIIY